MIASFWTQVSILLAIGAVLIVAYVTVPRPRTMWMIAFVTCMASFIIAIASATPPGYDPNVSAHGIHGAFAPHLAEILLAASGTATLSALGLRRTKPQPE